MSDRIELDPECTEEIAVISSYTCISDGKKLYYGGNQSWFAKEAGHEIIDSTGCGLISMADIFLCLKKAAMPITIDEYMVYVKRFNDDHVRLRRLGGILGSRFGMNNLDGRTGAILSRHFKAEALPFKAVCRSSPDSRSDAAVPADKRKSCRLITDSVKAGFPVIIGIGPCDQHKVLLYVKNKSSFVYSSATENHYVTITGVIKHTDKLGGRTDVFYRVSSWGREYYISADDLFEHLTCGDGLYRSALNRISNNITLVRRISPPDR